MKEELPLSIETLKTLSEEDVLALDPAKISDRDRDSALSQISQQGTKKQRGPKNFAFAGVPAQVKNKERWEQYFTNVAFSGDIFKIDQQELVRRAKQRPRKVFSPAVTGFTSWIYSLYRPQPSPSTLHRGRAAEYKISEIKGATPPEKKGWDLIYDDISGADPPAKKISSLTLDEKPLYGKPDLVFKERSSGNILILEIKHTYAKIPLNGWPNLSAQLWAYSQIDEWKDAPEIHLAAEIWSGPTHSPSRKATISWEFSDSSLIADNEQLFRLYGGHIG